VWPVAATATAPQGRTSLKGFVLSQLWFFIACPMLQGLYYILLNPPTLALFPRLNTQGQQLPPPAVLQQQAQPVREQQRQQQQAQAQAQQLAGEQQAKQGKQQHGQQQHEQQAQQAQHEQQAQQAEQTKQQESTQQQARWFEPQGYELAPECLKHEDLYLGIPDNLRPWMRKGITRADIDACGVPIAQDESVGAS